MTTIRASCPTCGQIDLPPEAVNLTICTVPERSSYTFDCPRCADTIRKPACDHVITLLASADVPTVVLEVPAEALEPHDGPTLTVDDLLDLHLELRPL